MSQDSDSRIDTIFDDLDMPDYDPGPHPGPVPGELHGMAGITRPDVIWWVQSYADHVAMLAAGYPQTVMLAPDGRRDVFTPLRDNEKKLAETGRFVLAGGDPDFLAELARRLGRHRVWIVRWPNDCAGAAEALERAGAEALRATVDAAEPYPIAGVYRPSSEEMIAYLRRPQPTVMTTGCEATDLIFKLPTEGKLIIVTGIPSHGKSTYVRHLMGHTARSHGRRWSVFSPEMGEWQDFCGKLIGWLADSPFRSLQESVISKWAEWCRSRFAFISRDSEDEAPTLDWLIDTYRSCVLRDGVTDCLLDPWNQIAHQRGALSETDYIDSALRQWSAFARRHGCNIWVVAHPTKLRGAKPGDPWPVPNAYDISGSSAWFNKADMILTVYRTDGLTQVHLQKAKFERWSSAGAGDATRGVFAELEYVSLTGRYKSLCEEKTEAPSSR